MHRLGTLVALLNYSIEEAKKQNLEFKRRLKLNNEDEIPVYIKRLEKIAADLEKVRKSFVEKAEAKEGK